MYIKENLVSYPGISGEYTPYGLYEQNIGDGGFAVINEIEFSNKKDKFMKNIIDPYIENISEYRDRIKGILYFTDEEYFFSSIYIRKYIKKKYELEFIPLIGKNINYINELGYKVNKTIIPKLYIKKLKEYMLTEKDLYLTHSFPKSDPDFSEFSTLPLKNDCLLSRMIVTLFGYDCKKIEAKLLKEKVNFIKEVSTYDELEKILYEKELIVLKKGETNYTGGSNTILLSIKDLDSEENIEKLKKYLKEETTLCYNFNPGLILKNDNYPYISGHIRPYIVGDDLKAIILKYPNTRLKKSLDIHSYEDIIDYIKNIGFKRRNNLNSSSGKSNTIVYLYNEDILEPYLGFFYNKGKHMIVFEDKVEEYIKNIKILHKDEFLSIEDYIYTNIKEIYSSIKDIHNLYSKMILNNSSEDLLEYREKILKERL